MTSRNFSLLAAVVFAIIALLQLTRAVAGWPVTVADATLPLWPSWVAFVVAGALALTGFRASRN